MPIYAVGDKVPVIHPSAFIAPTANIVGAVTVGPGASVWYGATLRGDTSYVEVHEGANIQDGSVVHGRAELPSIIHREASLAHNCVVHGAIIGARALIGAGSIVMADSEIPEGMLAVGAPAVVKRSIIGSPSEEWVTGNPARYAALAKEHMAGLREIDWTEATKIQ